MRRRLRLLRIAKRSGVVVCLMVVAIHIASAWWCVTAWSATRKYSYRSFYIGSGAVELRWRTDQWDGPAAGAWGLYRHQAPPMIWTPAVTRGPLPRLQWPFVSIIIPLWVLLLIAAIPTLVLWRLDRRPKPGHCPCGYNLTGNVSGVCPECGRRV